MVRRGHSAHSASPKVCDCGGCIPLNGAPVLVRHTDDNEGDASSPAIYVKIAHTLSTVKRSELVPPSSTCISHCERLFVLNGCQLKHVAHENDHDAACCASEDVTEQSHVVAIV